MKTPSLLLSFFVAATMSVACADAQPGADVVAPVPTETPIPTPPAARIVVVDSMTSWVNVMGTDTPRLPDFPRLDPKPGVVRGYARDWSGKPLAGAEIGLRTSYLAGYYTSAQARTDAAGYYEIKLPKGIAQFYNAGHSIEWGGGVAALSLHPADGSLDAFVTEDGAVEHFVLFPYGVTSREKVQQSPHLPSSFYGGALFFTWYGAEADDDNAPPFALRGGTTVEITLTPEGPMLGGTAGQTIIIRKTLGSSGELRVHNLPLGRYRLTVTGNGKALRMKEPRRYQPLFGMSPVETIGPASLLFIPGSATASAIPPQEGAWDWIGINLETP